MREKVLKLVVAFEETTDAIEAEQYFQKQKIEGRMIPLPGALIWLFVWYFWLCIPALPIPVPCEEHSDVSAQKPAPFLLFLPLVPKIWNNLPHNCK